MTDIQWEESFNTGIDEIDVQHQQLVSYLNDLHQAILDNNREAIALVIEELVDYTQIHFIFEEQLMRSMDYEFFSAHQRVHELFTARVIRYKRRFEHGEDITSELYNLLKRWLINHILHDDQNFAKVHHAQKAEEEYKKKNVLIRLLYWIKRRFSA